MRVIALLALCLAVVAGDPTKIQRIVGGTTTTIQQYPHMVSLLFSWSTNYRQSCGGVILNNRHILTAAHCTHNHVTNRFRARVGSTLANSGGIVHTIAAIINHPSYNLNAFLDSDIGILRTTGLIMYSVFVQPAQIAGTNYIVADNQSVWAVGWGTTIEGGLTTSEQLRHVEVYTVNQNTCEQLYRNTIYTITANMLCAGVLNVGGRDACQGDSGGPLYHRGVVVGITSFGEGCGRPNYPGVTTRVSSFTTWIQSRVN